MKTSKITTLLGGCTFTVAIICLLFTGCEKFSQQEENISPDNQIELKSTDDCVVDLLAAQSFVVGAVTIYYNSSSEITVTYTIADLNWCLVETHLDVQSDPGNFFQTNSGNPKIGHFAYSATLNCEPTWNQIIDLNTIQDWSEGEMIYIAAHAVVRDLSLEEETAWGEGELFPGNSWAMYFECEPPPDWVCGDLIIDDRDNQEYNTVQIGNQCWMAENLAYLPSVSPSSVSSYTTPIYYVYDYEGTSVSAAKTTSNYQTYGVLYNWQAAMAGSLSSNTVPSGVQGVCPAGWHLPADAEWCILTTYIDPTVNCNIIKGWSGIDAAYKMKSTSGWCLNGNGSDAYGFTVLPGGYRDSRCWFGGLTVEAAFWSSVEYNSDNAWYRYLCPEVEVYRGYYYKIDGLSVRCVKD